MTPNGAPEMTAPEILKLKAIAAMIEAADAEDEDDAKAVIKMIRTLIGEPKAAEAK